MTPSPIPHITLLAFPRKGIVLLLSLLTALFGTLHAQRNQPKQSYFDSLVAAQMGADTLPPQEQNNAAVQFFDMSKPLPGAMWYGCSFSTNRVRAKEMPLDSLPDEISLRLVRSDKEFCFPVKNHRTSPYGWRWNRPHRGVDIALRTGDPVHCAFPGVVRIACPMGGYGNVIVVRHNNGLETVYGHLSKIKVKPRQVVQAGTVIGLGGSTGHSTGPHLHFEVRFLYQAFDPEWIIDFSTYGLRTHWLHLDKTYFGITAPRGKHPPQDYKADKSFVKEQPRRQSGEKKEVYYTTQPDDSYKLVAIKYSTTVEAIKALNPNAPKKLKPGTKLRVR